MLAAIQQVAIALVVSLVVVVLSGSLVYLNQYMSPAQNLYHIPQNVVDICDAIVVPGREV